MNIAVTTGDPAGIGPDVALALLAARPDDPAAERLTLIGDPEVLAERAALLGVGREWENAAALLDVPTDAPVTAGRADPRNARHVLAQIDAAVTGCRNGAFDALVTCPVNKAAIVEGGIAFTGHTEYLAGACGRETVMMLACDTLRVALATTHLPLAAVPQALTREKLRRTLHIVHEDLGRLFGVTAPRIAVCGLNPHAGEGGHLGDEEQRVIRPVIEELVATMCLEGPLSADTAFTPRQLDRCDVVVAMYHDQGLPVIKHADFDNAVNVTLGLPFVRTSVDHGTALELAGTGTASPAGLAAAVACAKRLARNSRAGE